ncbi:MAG: hypothetical protein ISS57_13005 [Anaerolineales bacterium]|nr:hypothetical protein [Anaerolineales bacterium]
MNTIEITKKLKQSLVDYLATTFDVNKDGKEGELAYEIRNSFERPGALFTGPFLELILPYKTELTIRELCEGGVLSDSLLTLPCFHLDKPAIHVRRDTLLSHNSKVLVPQIQGSSTEIRHIG